MELPDEIVIEILRRLPAKSLLRFKCVSKFWNSTICDPHFVKSHHPSNSTQSQRLIIGKFIYTINLHTCKFDSNARVTSLNHFPKRNEIWKVIDTCNGLICALLHNHNFVILNPTTREFRFLPQTPRCTNSDFLIDIDGMLHGFGYDKVSDDYKLIKSERLVHRDGDEWKSHFMVTVFSLRSNCWRRINDSPHSTDLECEGTYVDGRIYWSPRYTWCPIIESFSIGNEKFETTSLPVDESILDDYELGKLDGRLCVSLTTEGAAFQIWTLKKSDDESTDCWTPLSAWRLTCLRSFCFPCATLAYTSSGDILVRFSDNRTTRVLVFNLMDDKSFTLIRVPGNPVFRYDDFVSTFVESLTSPYPLGN